MADNDSDKLGPALNQDQVEKIKVWLDTKWSGDKVCPICGNRGWGVDTRLSAPPVMDGAGHTYIGSSFPHVVVTCTNCGYVVTFSAIKIGVLDGVKGEDSDE